MAENSTLAEESSKIAQKKLPARPVPEPKDTYERQHCYHYNMGSAKANLKRKASIIEADAAAAATTTQSTRKPQEYDSDSDEFGDGLLEGVLDGDEDSEDDPSDQDYSDEEADEEGGSGSDSDLDSEDEIASEDIPTDDEAKDKSILANGTNHDQNGYENEEDEPNYRIEKDANGGVRYVYGEIDPVYDSDDTDAQGPVNTVRCTS